MHGALEKNGVPSLPRKRAHRRAVKLCCSSIGPQLVGPASFDSVQGREASVKVFLENLLTPPLCPVRLNAHRAFFLCRCARAEFTRNQKNARQISALTGVAAQEVAKQFLEECKLLSF